MSTVYDYSGTLVSKSSPNPGLTTTKRTVHIDSGDRDTSGANLNLYNGSFTVYLPRVYERIVSISIKTAEFPSLASANYTVNGSVAPSGTNQSGAPATGIIGTDYSISPPNYFLMEIDGLNRSDETAVGGNRSAYIDSVFAKFQIAGGLINPVTYNDGSFQRIIQTYSPPLARVDRLKITTRLHNQQRGDFIFWPPTINPLITPPTINPHEYSLTLEIETMENSFDNFSSMETRLR